MPKQISPKKTIPVTIRVPEEMNERIMKRINSSDEFKTRSDLAYRALYLFLDELDKRDKGNIYEVTMEPMPRPDRVRR